MATELETGPECRLQVEAGFIQIWPAESGFHQRANLCVIKAVDLNQDGKLDLVSANNDEKVTVHLSNAL